MIEAHFFIEQYKDYKMVIFFIYSAYNIKIKGKVSEGTDYKLHHK